MVFEGHEYLMFEQKSTRGGLFTHRPTKDRMTPRLGIPQEVLLRCMNTTEKVLEPRFGGNEPYEKNENGLAPAGHPGSRVHVHSLGVVLCNSLSRDARGELCQGLFLR